MELDLYSITRSMWALNKDQSIPFLILDFRIGPSQPAPGRDASTAVSHSQKDPRAVFCPSRHESGWATCSPWQRVCLEEKEVIYRWEGVDFGISPGGVRTLSWKSRNWLLKVRICVNGLGPLQSPCCNTWGAQESPIKLRLRKQLHLSI